MRGSATRPASRIRLSRDRQQMSGYAKQSKRWGAGPAPLRGGSAAAPAAARAAASGAGSCDGPPETTPMHAGRRARFCEGHF